MIDHSDENIITLIKEKSTENRGFKLLMDTFQQPLYSLIFRITSNHEDTDDILQNAFIKAFRGINKFQGNSKLSTWLYRIATNEALTFLKKKKRLRTSSIEELPVSISEARTENQIEENEILAHLKKAIDTLPEKQKLIFNMRYYQELSYKDISEILETSVGGLKANYHHAVKKIEHYFKKINIVY